MAKPIVIIVGESCKRDGIIENVDDITDTFHEIFGATVENWIDLPENELRRNIRELKKSDDWKKRFIQCKFIAIFCLAHGDSDGRICFHHGQEKPAVKDIKRTFLNPLFKIAELSGKLKWLIVQSCRGDLNDLAKQLEMQTDGDDETVVYLDYYLISYCTGEATFSAQENSCGKVFIEEICRELRNNARTETVINMLTNVHSAVEVKNRKYENPSRPVYETNCLDDLRLFDEI